MNQPELFKAVFDKKSPLGQMSLIRRAIAYIDDNDLMQHYRNFYANDDEVIFIMSDRNAALMLKLSLT